ncbi:hypothetical protein [Burkholderia pseudomallei]|uniref:hypothetical protein n=2 Tax=Burkholderia pseudomallei TaxID=28450 RepID=UPI0005E91D4F|nr:hypothetical protein [Burkholderia pseudomallei]QUN94017.1 hypothetical protein KEX44_07825 [Burkholderia pseudomallei]CAK1282005.1 Uncharacterised protein [Burkholderia pseudomallei]CAK1319644.1 Uncharacterised protein [Burkholderia pseudomallei]CAK1320731.1 Uncharacterised protein [Burkholderia pseudomallei]CFK42889.1 Uncharacterised protein [Burkholderia pseudomallei]
MTCIVAVKHETGIYMGADSAAVGGWTVWDRLDPKIYRVGPFLIGFTTSYRMGQLLGHSFSVPDHLEGVDTFAFMCTTFVDAVRECLKKGGFALRENEREEAGTFLCAYRGRVFRVESDYQIGESATNFDACGCGQEFALGSLYSTSGMEPEQRVRTALCAAQRFSAGVREPFLIEVAR